MSTVVYDYCDGLYVNLTNRCPTRCEFCIKYLADGLGSADSLFLDKEPTVDEVTSELESWGMDNYDEVVFCGYGEPTERLDDLLEVAKYIKDKHPGMKTRINTIGLSDLINEKETAPMLEGLIDAVNVSMNEADAEKFNALCHPIFGEKESYDAMIKFIKDVKEHVPYVVCSVVTHAISRESIEACRKKCEELGVDFKLR